MKKFLAILLAMMLVLVNVMALAEGDDYPMVELPTEEETVNEPAAMEGTEGEGTSTTPAATTAATAADPSVDTGYDESTAPFEGLTAPVTVQVYKNFNITGTGAKLPAQTVSFTVGEGVVTNSSTVTTAPAVTIDDVVFTETDVTAELKKEVNINLPAYSGVGVYTYPVTETDTNVAGVSYASNLELKVTVIQGENGLVIAGIALRQNDVKTDTMENDYEANALTVGKTVAGNIGDQNKVFPITVVLTAPSGDKVYGSVGVTITGDDATVTDDGTDITTTIAAEIDGWETKTLKLSLKHNQTVQFDNLPKGVTYTVVEDADIKHLDSDSEEQDNPEAYLVEEEVKTATELTADTTVTIKNTKNMDIDTGVALDSLPYMLLMTIAMLGAALLVARRREEY